MKTRRGPGVFFAGSNFFGPKLSNKHAKKWVEDAVGEVVKTAYVTLGKGKNGEFPPVIDLIEYIKRQRPFVQGHM